MLTDAPIYAKHPVRPQTPEAQVRAWKRRHRMIECELYSCSRSGVIVQSLIDFFARQEGKRPAFVKQYARTLRERLATEK